MFQRLAKLLFPPKCVLCRSLLPPGRTELCAGCAAKAPVCEKPTKSIPFVEKWTALWYYNDIIRRSFLRYKFYNARSYAVPYGKLLAARLAREYPDGVPLLTWAPISKKRKRKRGYDQTELIARVVARELGVPLVPVLTRVLDSGPQSSLRDAAARRANVLGAYRVTDRDAITGKTVLLLDDIITTGVTVSECAKTLLTAGAAGVHCAALATPTLKK